MSLFDDKIPSLSLFNERKSQLCFLLGKEEKQARAVTKSLGLRIHEVVFLVNDYLHDDPDDDVMNVNAEIAVEVGALAEVVLHAATPPRIPIPQWGHTMNATYDVTLAQFSISKRKPQLVYEILKFQFTGLNIEQVKNQTKRIAKTEAVQR